MKLTLVAVTLLCALPATELPEEVAARLAEYEDGAAERAAAHEAQVAEVREEAAAGIAQAWDRLEPVLAEAQEEAQSRGDLDAALALRDLRERLAPAEPVSPTDFLGNPVDGAAAPIGATGELHLEFDREIEVRPLPEVLTHRRSEIPVPESWRGRRHADLGGEAVTVTAHGTGELHLVAQGRRSPGEDWRPAEPGLETDLRLAVWVRAVADGDQVVLAETRFPVRLLIFGAPGGRDDRDGDEGGER